MKEEQKDGMKASAFAALALAFGSFGDAFLYPFLPVNSLDVGVPVLWVGMLLSINRFVRILSNTMMVHLFAKYGLRVVMIGAALLAIGSTFGYAIATGLITWLLFRIMWGISFSAMRIGSLGYALRQERIGFSLGISKGLQDAGPMLTMFMAPFLLMYFEARTIFYLLGLLSLPALYFAWRLPAGNDKTPSIEVTRFLRRPSSLNSITLLSAILIDGIIVVVLGVLFLNYRDDIDLMTATTLAAIYLGYRRICLVALSPFGGWLADRIGLDRIFNLSMMAIVVGVLIIALGWIGTGAVVVFTFYSINSAITPGSASQGSGHSLAAVAENATWRDVGAAIGTLTGGFLLTSHHLNTFLLSTTFALAAVAVWHMGTAKKVLALLYRSK